MDVAAFCRQSGVVVVVGKGGVGKTTVSSSLALLAARAGLSVTLASVTDAGGITALFGSPATLDFDETPLVDLPGAGRVVGRLLSPDAALVEYLHDHGLGRLSRRLADTGVLDVVSTAIPGIREVLVLGKVKQLERSGASDLIVLDAPATGHAVRFLTSSGGLLDAARGGPLRSQAEQIVELLADPARCQVLLVTIPEETPVNEAAETAFRLEDEVGVALGPVVVNDYYPPLAHLDDDVADAARHAGARPSAAHLDAVRSAAAFRAARQALQATQLDRLAASLPLAQLRLSHLFSGALGADELGGLADELGAGIEALA